MDACIGFTSWRSFCLSLLTHGPAVNLSVALNRDGFTAVVVVITVSSLPLQRGHGMQ